MEITDLRLWEKTMSTTNSFRSVAKLVSLACLVTAMAGCQKTDTTAGAEGPAEAAGAQIDKAAVKAGEQLNKLAEQAGKGLEKAGEKLQSAAQEAQKNEPQEK
jgi:hypothetical protein